MLLAVWGEADSDRNRLAVALYLLKRDLARIGCDLGDMLDASRETLRLNGGAVRTDWQAFLDATEQARRSQGSAREVFARQAVDLYAGPILPDSDAVWVWPIRSEAQVAFRESVLWLAGQEIDRANPAGAQAWLARLQRTDPGSLAMLAAVTEWLWMQGNVREAQECAARLMRAHAQLGQVIAPANRELVNRILGPSLPDRWGAKVQTHCWMDLDAEGQSKILTDWGAAANEPFLVSDPVAALEIARQMVPEYADKAVLTTCTVLPGEDPSRTESYAAISGGGVYANRATLEVLKASGYAVVAERTGEYYRVDREG